MFNDLAAASGLFMEATLTRLAAQTLVNVCLGAGLCGMTLAGCTMEAIPPPYTQDELKAICERRRGRWHDGDPTRSFCESPMPMRSGAIQRPSPSRCGITLRQV